MARPFATAWAAEGAVLLSFVSAAGIAHAVPLANSVAAFKIGSVEFGLVEQAHACNRVCERGPVEEWGGRVRWHLHVGKSCRPVTCSPQ